MNTTAARRPAAPQPLLSIASRVGAAMSVVGVLALTSVSAGHASQQAVQTATDCFSRGPAYVTLPRTEVVGKRDTSTLKSI